MREMKPLYKHTCFLLLEEVYERVGMLQFLLTLFPPVVPVGFC